VDISFYMNKRFQFKACLLLCQALFIAFLIISCEFVPSKKYTLSLSRPSSSENISFDLNILTDTISFYWQSSVILKLKTPKLKFNSVKYFLDDNEYIGNYSDSIATISMNFYQPGSHKFKMIVYTNSGTNSLADKLGAEGYQFESREWVLIAKELQTNVNSSTLVDKNGISIFWKKYDGVDISGYRVKDPSTGLSYDVDTNFYCIHTYVGQGGIYLVYVLDHANHENLWARSDINKSLPSLRIGGINNKVALIWNQSIFKDNISEYQVFKGDLYYHWTKLATLSTNDTSILLDISNLPFAQAMSFYLYCPPKYYSAIDNESLFSSFLQNVNVALPGPRFNSNFGLNCSGFYFDSYSSELGKTLLYKYSTSTDKVDAIMDYSWVQDISPNAKYLLSPHDSIMDLYDLSTNTLVKSLNIHSVSLDYYKPSISDNGICAFYSNNVLYVFDILNNRLISAKSQRNAGVIISPDGKYISRNSADSLIIFKVNANSISYQASLQKPAGSYTFPTYSFCPNQPDQMYGFESPYLSVRSCTDLTILRTLDIGSDYFYNIDFCSNKVMTGSNFGGWRIWDFNTFTNLQNIATAYTGSSNYTLICNNTIFCAGYKYYLNK
jgi:hypothetical protein